MVARQYLEHLKTLGCCREAKQPGAEICSMFISAAIRCFSLNVQMTCYYEDKYETESKTGGLGIGAMSETL